MSKISSLVFIFSLMVSPLALARKHYVVFGGGGEPKSRDWTIFDQDMKLTGELLLQKSDWSYEYAINGGHAKTDEIAQKYFPKQKEVTPLTKENYEKMLDQILKDLKEGKYKAGDQLVVQINTHGAMTNRGRGDLTHMVAASSGLINLDKLKDIFDLAAKNGVQSALFDFSCYSGASLALANINTCVVTGSGEFNVGYVNSSTTFSQRFLKALGNGKSVEQNFLEARRGDIHPSYPSISTAAGMSLYKNLYQKDLHRYLFRWYNEIDKMVLADDKCLEEDTVARYSQIGMMLKLNSRLENYLKETQDEKQINAFQKALAEYHQVLQQMIDDNSKLTNMKELNQAEVFQTGFGDGRDAKFNVYKILLTPANPQFDNYLQNSQLGALDPALAKEVDLYRQVRARRVELEKQFPQYIAQAPLRQRLVDNTDKLNKLAKDVGRNERAVYDKMYKQIPAPFYGSPCSRFKM